MVSCVGHPCTRLDTAVNHSQGHQGGNSWVVIQSCIWWQHLVCSVLYWNCQNPNLTSTLRLGIFVKMTFHNHHHIKSMSTISQLLLTQFWWNFKCRFLGTFRKDSYCHVDICPGNICPGDICPYQECVSCYRPDFDETLKVAFWEHLEQIPTIKLTFVQATFVLVTFVHIRNISTVTDPILIKL